jgi:hypothetical protein
LSQAAPEELPLDLLRPPQPSANMRSAIAPPVAPFSSPPPPPAPPVAYESVAPVTATVITPPFNTTLAPLATAKPQGSLRGVLVGAVLGLAIVGAFVAGTRLALRNASTSPAAAAAQLPAAPVVATPALVSQEQPEPATTLPGGEVPVIAATQLPLAPLPKKHHGWKRAPKTAPQPSPDSSVATGALAPIPPSAPAVATASAAQVAESDTDDSAPSLVPVIPAASAPPPVDPLLKAIQTAVDEDDKAKGHH